MHFFKRRQREPIEKLLVEQRPEPTDVFLRSVTAQLQGEKRGFSLRARPAGVRILAATSLTTLALAGATAAAGGVGAASHGIASIAKVSKTLDIHSAKNTSKSVSTKGDQRKAGRTKSATHSETKLSRESAAHQYSVTICHATASRTNPYVQLTLSPQGAAEHLAHHPGDFLAPPGGCPVKHKK